MWCCRKQPSVSCSQGLSVFCLRHSALSCSGPVHLQWSQAFTLDPFNQPLMGSGTDSMVPLVHSCLASLYHQPGSPNDFSGSREKKERQTVSLAGANRPLSDSIILPCCQSQGSGLHLIAFCPPRPPPPPPSTSIITEAGWQMISSTNQMLLEHEMTAITECLCMA